MSLLYLPTRDQTVARLRKCRVGTAVTSGVRTVGSRSGPGVGGIAVGGAVRSTLDRCPGLSLWRVLNGRICSPWLGWTGRKFERRSSGGGIGFGKRPVRGLRTAGTSSLTPRAPGSITCMGWRTGRSCLLRPCERRPSVKASGPGSGSSGFGASTVLLTMGSSWLLWLLLPTGSKAWTRASKRSLRQTGGGWFMRLGGFGGSRWVRVSPGFVGSVRRCLRHGGERGRKDVR